MTDPNAGLRELLAIATLLADALEASVRTRPVNDQPVTPSPRVKPRVVPPVPQPQVRAVNGAVIDV